MSKKPFEKFINKQSPAAKKEAFKQEKRKQKKAAREKGELYRSKKDTERRQTDNFQVTRNLAALRKKRGDVDEPEEKMIDKPIHATSVGKPINKKGKENVSQPAEEMPLNKFISHAGVCGRREAAELVKAGFVTVNDDKVFEPAYRVTANDKVVVKGKQVHLQKNLVYILLNKPKDYITTAKDPEGRKTVFELIKKDIEERVYPVGRLDRNTTGVLLLTNDGELAQKLTHPSFNVKKIYEVRLDKPLEKKHFEAILAGIDLEDGRIVADSLGHPDPKDKTTVGIEIHSGKNRVVRRIFEHLGYDVKGLDRVMFANLTKKNVDRGRYRLLNDKEIRLLKFLNQSFVKKKQEDQAVDEIMRPNVGKDKENKERHSGSRPKTPADGRPVAKPSEASRRSVKTSSPVSKPAGKGKSATPINIKKRLGNVTRTDFTQSGKRKTKRP